ncbi:MAG: hypothetical protein NT093_01535 [Candidatus Moranbacteria bacterium]|nr:hypothetical protein [Candidatus Moranbacteria bacterium]
MKKFWTIALLAVFFSGLSLARAEARSLSLPKQIIHNKFGFLYGGGEESKLIKKYHAGWARPHTGPFVWGNIQETAGASFDYSRTDALVRDFARKKIGTLATLWPFAEWDQLMRGDAELCKVSEKDQFLPNGKEGSVGLSQYRCDPFDWSAYQNWVRNVVERYDGDGVDDMPGLKYPVKYWEVMNEPDLEGSETLDFFVGNATDYRDLLISTYSAVKTADPTADVLIAGAANVDPQNLDFYRDVFRSEEARNSFDIANVHCISSGDVPSLNVGPYKEMLSEFGLDAKPLWVTEAEVMVSGNKKENARQLTASAKEARRLGANRIFFTRFSLNATKDYGDWDLYSRKIYRNIFKKKWAL